MSKPFMDLTGCRYGRLVVKRKLQEKIRKEEAWECDCDCGNITEATKSQLLSGRKKSCGCLRKESPRNFIDLTGQKFGKLTVIGRAGKTKKDNAVWLCRCDCGKEKSFMGTTLRRGDAVSCGCQKDSQIENARSILENDMTIDGVHVPLLTKRVRSDSGTGHKGVHLRIRKGHEYYEASITVKGKRYYLGEHKSLDDAIAARKTGEEKYHHPIIEELKRLKEEQ